MIIVYQTKMSAAGAHFGLINKGLLFFPPVLARLPKIRDDARFSYQT